MSHDVRCTYNQDRREGINKTNPHPGLHTLPATQTETTPQLQTLEAVAEERKRRKAEAEAKAKAEAAARAEAERAAKEAAGEEVYETTESQGVEELQAEADQQGAFNPETGEINWDCPCLGGMAHGPCGEEFKAAFSCFVYSTEEPKGMDCIEKFKYGSLGWCLRPGRNRTGLWIGTWDERGGLGRR